MFGGEWTDSFDEWVPIYKFDSLFKRLLGLKIKMPSSVPGLILTSGGDIKTAKVTIQTEATGLQISDIQKYLKKKTVPQLLGNYAWKGQSLHLFGFKEGKAGTENKHELPPPLDNQLFFGDILVILSKDKKNYSKPLPFKAEEYESFYTNMFEGFEDLDNDEEDDFEGEDDVLEDEEEVYASEADADEKFEDEEEIGDEEPIAEDDEEPVQRAPKQEDDEEEGEVETRILITKKKPSKLSKSRAKQSKETNLYLGGVELQAESIVPTSPPDHPQRQKVYEICAKYLNPQFTQSQWLELEHVIYNSSLLIANKKHILANWAQPLYVEIYTSLARSLIGNLQPNNYIQNDTLFKRFQKGEVTLSELGTYTFSDLYPDIWKDLSIRQFEREKRLLEGNRSMATDQFQCKRCNKRECTYYELQTRSADEPMTIFINCLNCGKHWRQ